MRGREKGRCREVEEGIISAEPARGRENRPHERIDGSCLHVQSTGCDDWLRRVAWRNGDRTQRKPCSSLKGGVIFSFFFFSTHFEFFSPLLFSVIFGEGTFLASKLVAQKRTKAQPAQPTTQQLSLPSLELGRPETQRSENWGVLGRKKGKIKKIQLGKKKKKRLKNEKGRGALKQQERVEISPAGHDLPTFSKGVSINRSDVQPRGQSHRCQEGLRTAERTPMQWRMIEAERPRVALHLIDEESRDRVQQGQRTGRGGGCWDEKNRQRDSEQGGLAAMECTRFESR